jgi:MSHA pilin protein MshD
MARGFTMVEATVSVVLVAVLLVVAMNTVGVSNANQYRSAQRATADALAEGLLEDVVQLPYEDTAVLPLFGVELGETTLSKVNYDDVDDFNGWTESPPQDRAGAAMSELSGWTRTVKVEWVTVANPTTVSLLDTGLKRVTVTVSKGGVVLATRAGLKGRHL